MITCATVLTLAPLVGAVVFSPPPLLIGHYQHPYTQVEFIRIESGEVRSEVLLEDVALIASGSSFQCADSGRFIYLSPSGTWHVGDAKSREAPKPIPASLVPEKPDYAAVSNCGKRIAWTNQPSGRLGSAASLALTDLNREVTHTTFKEGWLLYPAWSTDDAYIAYYHGPPGAVVGDGFALMRLDPARPDAPELELAPPSMPTRLTPVRDRPPLWSPDGRRLLFEARYDQSIPPIGPRYHVAATGDGAPERAAASRWYRDGDHMLTAVAPGGGGVGQNEYALAVLDLTRPQSPQNPRPLPITVPTHSQVGPCTNDGKYLVYRTRLGEVYIVEIDTGAKKKVFEWNGTCEFYWVP